MKRVCVIVLFLGIYVFGCAPAIKKVYLLPERLTPKPDDYPISLYSTKQPECPYEEIGIITSRQRNVFITMKQVTESLRKEARKMGGDAVIKVQLGDKAMSAITSDNSISIDHDAVLSGVVIKWTDEGCNY